MITAGVRIKVKCPFCSFEETKVLDKRESDEHANRRRRECIKCAKRFTTYERIESTPIMVIKKNGSRAQFDPEKIKKGIIIASQKTKVTLAQIDAIIAEIEMEIKTQSESEEIPSRVIGEKVMEKLKLLDPVAYIRFAAVYKEFKDVKEIEKELRELKVGQKTT